MADDKKPTKTKRRVAFNAETAVEQKLNAKPKRELPKGDMMNHPKFAKFKRGE